MLRFAPGSGAERFSTRTRKTFNISTEFYTEYSGFSTAFDIKVKRGCDTILQV